MDWFETMQNVVASQPKATSLSAEAQALVAIGQIILARAIHDDVGGLNKNRATPQKPRYRGYNGYN